MSQFTQGNLTALEVTAASAAAYLDACDGGALYIRLDPAYYRVCAHLLAQILALTNPPKDFPALFERSAAVREAAESLRITHRIEMSKRVFYPELAVLMDRISK